MFPFPYLRCWFTLIMCAVCFTCMGDKKVMRNSDGDKFTIQYAIDHKEGKTVVSFTHVSDIQLGKNKAKYSQKQDKGLVRAIFMDGRKFNEDEIIIIPENNVSKWSEFKTPAHWKYEPQSQSAKVFCLNDRNVNPQIAFTGEQDQQFLSIPIYLAYITTKTKWDKLRKKGTITFYHIFSEFEPLEIKLTMPKEQSVKPGQNLNPDKTKEIHVPVDTTIIDPDSDSDLVQNQHDLAAKKLINDIQREMDKNAGLTDYAALKFYDQLKPQIESLEELKKDASDLVQQDIDNLTAKYDDGRKKAEDEIIVIKQHDGYVLRELDKLDNRLDSCSWKRLGLIDDIEKVYQNLCQGYTDKVSPIVQHELTDFDQKISRVKDKLKIFIIIRNILLGLLAFIVMALGFLGYGRWKNNLEQKKMKSFEEIQRRMAKRAEREAERRTRSVAQNKTRQVIGQARNKGRQAVQSKAREMGERVSGKKPRPTEMSSNDTSSINNGTNSRPPIGKFSGRRRPKPGSNGEISI